MLIMSDHSACVPFVVPVHQPRGLTAPTFATPVTQAATALIAVTAFERGLDFSAE
ncbi:hypothetical protein J2Z50_006620 [Ensifer mexicanus]|nr:hypothetical protein [Sinorhizobium mexicanum]